MLIFLVLCSFSTVAKNTDAQNVTITILPDGTVEPSWGIQRDGDIYTLTANLKCRIEIQRDGITLNGANHTLQGSGRDKNQTAIALKASNITITNCRIVNWTAGIYGAYNNNSITGNEFTNNTRAIALYATDYIISKNIIEQNGDGIYIKDSLTHTGDNNLIINNQIANNSRAVNLINSDGTTITQNNVTNNDEILAVGRQPGRLSVGYHWIYLNNFVDNKKVLYFHIDQPILSGLSTISPAGNWDNGKTGNYWSDYTTKYPNASETNKSGIGNTPYTVESDHIPWSVTYGSIGNKSEGITILGSGVDCYPLIRAYDIPTDGFIRTYDIPMDAGSQEPGDLISTPAPSSTASDSSGTIPVKYATITILLLTILITILTIAAYRRKHQQN
jgi:hypothetical protein